MNTFLLTPRGISAGRRSPASNLPLPAPREGGAGTGIDALEGRLGVGGPQTGEE